MLLLLITVTILPVDDAAKPRRGPKKIRQRVHIDDTFAAVLISQSTQLRNGSLSSQLALSWLIEQLRVAATSREGFDDEDDRDPFPIHTDNGDYRQAIQTLVGMLGYIDNTGDEPSVSVMLVGNLEMTGTVEHTIHWVVRKAERDRRDSRTTANSEAKTTKTEETCLRCLFLEQHLFLILPSLGV